MKADLRSDSDCLGEDRGRLKVVDGLCDVKELASAHRHHCCSPFNEHDDAMFNKLNYNVKQIMIIREVYKKQDTHPVFAGQT